MSEIFNILLSLSLILGILLFISEDMRYGRIIEWGAGLIFASVVISPLVSLIYNFDFTPPAAFEPDGWGYIEYTEDAFCDGVLNALCDKYGIETHQAKIKTEGFDFNTMSCKKITVTLSGGAVIKDSGAIKRYLEQNLCIECEVRLEFG